ncbi:MAG: site-specific DNA-methyltransferase [Victivallales bacterium]|nr:site-specific DNA-methyltransferase [Victivallales bacterium]
MPTLEWIGKKAVENHHRDVPFHLLEEIPELSFGDKDSGNLLVQGDNLVALKALLPYYAGKVKCIYIDPPYNTGNESWVYNDNVNDPQIKEWLGNVVGKEAEDLTRHDKWLCMMYPRLKILKEFLDKEEGSIWISIDDSEVVSLRMLMNEIFGENKFIASIVWQKRYSRENREAIGDVHEYLIVFAMNPTRFKASRNKVLPTEKQTKVYKNPNNDPKGRWRPVPMTAQEGHATAEQFYEITTPSGKKHLPPKGRCWGVAKSTYERLLSEGRIYFGKKGDSQPNIIRYLSEIEGFVPWTWWPYDEVGHTDEAKKEIHALFGKTKAFDTPKPLRLIQQIFSIASNPGDLVLDSFAGTGTAGHAALSLKDSNNVLAQRKFILVEMDESVASKTTAIRLKKAIDGYNDIKGNHCTGIDSGFRYYRLGKPLFDHTGKVYDGVTFSQLARHVFFTETGSPLNKDECTSPLIGIYNATAVYLLFNGILKDKKPDSGNVLTSKVLKWLPEHDGSKVVYGTACRLSPVKLRQLNIEFKQIPYDIKVD